MSLREDAEADMADIVADDGYPCVVTPPGAEAISTNAIGSDIASLLNPVTGEPVAGRSIEVSVPMRNVTAEPQRGWTVEFKNVMGKDVKTFVQEHKPDYTIGLWLLVLGTSKAAA
jgi:hypothetical protein